MNRFLIASLLAISATACTHAVLSSALQSSLDEKKIMTSTANLTLSIVNLQAREEKRLPIGASPNPNRDIGFASVFLRLENAKENGVSVTIQRIEIRNAANGSVQMSSTSPQEVGLRPLENSELAFHLTNKTGYSNDNNSVKAVIIYQVGDQEGVIESNTVEIQRY